MTGGIQPGTVAADAKSKALEKDLKVATRLAFSKLKPTYPHLTWVSKLDGDWFREHLTRPIKFTEYVDIYSEELDKRLKGAQPDGSLFFYMGVPIAVFEAKKQNKAGNAIERWYKNYFVFSNLALPFRPLYVTFMTGPGAEPGAVMSTSLAPTLAVLGRTFNHLYPEGLSIFRKIDSFEPEELNQTAFDALTYGIQLCEAYIPKLRLQELEAQHPDEPPKIEPKRRRKSG